MAESSNGRSSARAYAALPNDEEDLEEVTPHEASTETTRSSQPLVQSSQALEDNEFDIPADAYGSAILAIVKDSPKVFSGSCTGIVVVRLVFALLLLALNLALQGSILYFINTQVVNHSVRHVQEIYRDFHQRSFDVDGSFEPDLWADETGKAELCQIAMTNPLFYFCTLSLWTVSMVGEFRQGKD